MQNKLWFRFAALLILVLLTGIVIFQAANQSAERTFSESRVLNDARLLSKEMEAVWSYIDAIQGTINYDGTGTYDFKGIYCSVAGKNIARRFTQSTDTTIRYTRFDPRTPTDAPDEFEARALVEFEAGTATEYWGVDEYQGQQVFRYLSNLEVKGGCLDCHGDPAGEIDEVNYPKEGMQLGDSAGAVSLIIPMAPYIKEAHAQSLRNVALFVGLACAIVVMVSLALHHWVIRPVNKLLVASQHISNGDFDQGGIAIDAPCELADLTDQFSDMTERLKGMYGELEGMVADRTRKLEQINTELRRANEIIEQESEAQSTFLSTVTHEMKTPLTSIIAFVDVWQKSDSPKAPDDVFLMARIKESAQSLLSTISDSLDATSIRSKVYSVELVPVDLYDLAGAVEETIRPIAENKGVSLVANVESGVAIVSTDPGIVLKIVRNLMSNAIKFTESGGSVTLNLGFDTARSLLCIRVADTGIGIAPEDLDAVFERFTQANSSVSRRYGGSGLGLFLVKEFAGLLGGTVDVSSEVGKGSVFTVYLPSSDAEK